MSTQDTEYDPFDDDLPRVQIPLGRDQPGLTIDGDFMTLFELPEDAREAYIEYAEQGGEVRIWQCDRCGYLTDADAFRSSTYNQAYECGGCGARLKGTTQHGARESATQVHGPTVGKFDDEDAPLDVAALVPDTKCDADHGETVSGAADRPRRGRSPARTEIDEDARDCPKCVPNHPSHLGKLKNRAGGLTRGEMMQRVAEAVKEFREA